MTRTRELRTTAPVHPRTQGDRIRVARINSGLSQLDFAQQINKISGANTTKSHVSMWERNQIESMAHPILWAMQAISGYSAQWISTGKGEQKAVVAVAKGLDSNVLGRAIGAVLPEVTQAQIAAVSSLYDVILDTPDVSDKSLASFAAALLKRI